MGEIKIPVSFITFGFVEASCCCLNIKESYFVFSNLNIVRHCQKQNFLSNPRRIHSEGEDEEKEE